jgi:hypothetical protein
MEEKMDKAIKHFAEDILPQSSDEVLLEMADIMDKMTDLHERDGHEAQRKSLEPYNLAITEELIKRGLVSY